MRLEACVAKTVDMVVTVTRPTGLADALIGTAGKAATQTMIGAASTPLSDSSIANLAFVASAVVCEPTHFAPLLTRTTAASPG